MRIPGLDRMILAVVLCSATGSDATSQDGPRADRAGSAIEGLRASDVQVRRDAATRIRVSGRDLQREALPEMIRLLIE